MCKPSSITDINTKAELHELLKDGQPVRAVAEEIAVRFMRFEAIRTGSSWEACRVYEEIMALCGYQPADGEYTL